MTAKKKPKSTQAKPAGKKTPKDYGVGQKPATDFKPPAGFSVGATTRINGFNQIGDKAEGDFEGVQKSERKKQSDLLLLRQADGLVQKWWCSQDVQTLLTDNKIEKGQHIILIFVDAVKMGKNRTYKMFNLYFKPKGRKK